MMSQRRSKIIAALLYDMHVLCAAIQMLKSAESGKRDEDKATRDVALAAILLKSRAIIDFLGYGVAKSKGSKPLKASMLDAKYKPKVAEKPDGDKSNGNRLNWKLERIQLIRDSANKWAAHLTERRINNDGTLGKKPPRRLSRTVGAEILRDAVEFVRQCTPAGQKLGTGSSKYLSACEKMPS